MQTPNDTVIDAPGLGQSARRLLRLAFALLLVAVSLALGSWLGRVQMAVVEAGSPAAGFVRDMAVHHAQAVEMAVLLRDRTDDPAMRQLALDILLTQQAQIGQMRGWLAVWGLPQARTEPAMAWMGMPTTGLMPGMTTPEQLQALRAAEGLAAEGLFLQLMIRHHKSGITMAQAILDRDPPAVVVSLAQSIVASQQNEIAYMQDLLEQKGFPRESEDAAGGHENMGP